MISDYGQYASRLRQLLSSLARDGASQHQAAVLTALDGQAATELRRLVSVDVRREQGAFFTTSALRQRAVPRGVSLRNSVVFDPACGAGDLLIEAAMRLPVYGSYDETVQCWGERLLGSDLHGEFVDTARLRLLIAAAYRSGRPFRVPGLHTTFPGLVVGDGLLQASMARRANRIVLNPPFGYVGAPKGARWASGRVSAAAVFLERVIEYAPIGTAITAILPDVLRSGSRYAKWRNLVSTNMAISRIESHGLFDRATDVDVFILDGKKRTHGDSVSEWVFYSKAGKVVEDFFDVHVGPVVPYRDPNRGPWHPYIWPRRLPSSGHFNPEGRSRRFNGRTFLPPFVAIRRTSRPGQALRADGVLIVGSREVAVENHLIVAAPKDGRESSCLALLELLEDVRTRDWLDERIRTRHLTVSSIREIPWLAGTNG